MPIFEYMCVECGNTFEKLVRTSDSQPVICPKCESERVQKQLSTFAVSGSSQTRAVNAPAVCSPGGG